MAGRGCTITVRLLSNDSQSEVISLPVALHSPLDVLKDLLSQQSDIPPNNQVRSP
jgi:hypothetical protein